MPLSIAPRAAVERLQQADFLLRNSGTTPTHRYEEFERQQPGFLQRLVVYALKDAGAEQPDHAVLRTKCSPKPHMATVYDVEHLLSRGADCVQTLVDAADAHAQQFATSGGSSFFSQTSDASPHYDMRRPLEVPAS